MRKVEHQIKVLYSPNYPFGETYETSARDEDEAHTIKRVLNEQLEFLHQQGIITLQRNTFTILMHDNNIDEWVEYWNEDESLNWDEFEKKYYTNVSSDSLSHL